MSADYIEIMNRICNDNIYHEAATLVEAERIMRRFFELEKIEWFHKQVEIHLGKLGENGSKGTTRLYEEEMIELFTLSLTSPNCSPIRFCFGKWMHKSKNPDVKKLLKHLKKRVNDFTDDEFEEVDGEFSMVDSYDASNGLYTIQKYWSESDGGEPWDADVYYEDDYDEYLAERG